MAEIIAIAATIFAGVTAIMNASSAYAQYRQNNPRPKKTGAVPNYTTAHGGLSMRTRRVPDDEYKHLLLTLPDDYRSRGTPESVGRLPAPASPSTGRSTSNMHLAPSGRIRTRLRYIVGLLHIQRRGFGGQIIVLPEQTARDTYTDTAEAGYGMNTGSLPGWSGSRNNNIAEAHWKSFQTGHYGLKESEASAVAVVDWTKACVTMFVVSENMFYRQYKVSSCNVAAFGEKYKGEQVFSGIIKGGQLVACNRDLFIVEDDGECTFRSSNCWNQLGFSGDGVTTRVFIQMVRAAVFGLISCLYQQPNRLNVDMSFLGGVDFVHVDSAPGDHLTIVDDCCFSVFSFRIDTWAKENVLVG